MGGDLRDERMDVGGDQPVEAIGGVVGDLVEHAGAQLVDGADVFEPHRFEQAVPRSEVVGDGRVVPLAGRSHDLAGGDSVQSAFGDEALGDEKDRVATVRVSGARVLNGLSSSG